MKDVLIERTQRLKLSDSGNERAGTGSLKTIKVVGNDEIFKDG